LVDERHRAAAAGGVDVRHSSPKLEVTVRFVTSLTATLVVLLSAVVGSGQDKEKPSTLPGARGPLFEKIGKLKDGVEVQSADVSHEVKELKFHPAEPPKTRTLPAGTSSGFRVGVSFNKEPVGKCSIEIYNTAGKADFGYAHTTSTDGPTGRCTMIFTGQGKEKLADGPYQAKVKIGDDVVLLVNWHIGEPSK
jgi:hypothetical protein